MIFGCKRFLRSPTRAQGCVRSFPARINTVRPSERAKSIVFHEKSFKFRRNPRNSSKIEENLQNQANLRFFKFGAIIGSTAPLLSYWPVPVSVMHLKNNFRKFLMLWRHLWWERERKIQWGTHLRLWPGHIHRTSMSTQIRKISKISKLYFRDNIGMRCFRWNSIYSTLVYIH